VKLLFHQIIHRLAPAAGSLLGGADVGSDDAVAVADGEFALWRRGSAPACGGPPAASLKPLTERPTMDVAVAGRKSQRSSVRDPPPRIQRAVGAYRGPDHADGDEADRRILRDLPRHVARMVAVMSGQVPAQFVKMKIVDRDVALHLVELTGLPASLTSARLAPGRMRQVGLVMAGGEEKARRSDALLVSCGRFSVLSSRLWTNSIPDLKNVSFGDRR